MNDEIDGGVDVGMDHGGETELRVGVPLWPLLLESDSTLTSMAWFPETCNQYQHNLSEAESASCWCLNQLCHWSALGGIATMMKGVWSPPTDRLNPQ
jgi:hypothetical protein